MPIMFEFAERRPDWTSMAPLSVTPAKKSSKFGRPLLLPEHSPSPSPVPQASSARVTMPSSKLTGWITTVGVQATDFDTDSTQQVSRYRSVKVDAAVGQAARRLAKVLDAQRLGPR
eukprot:2485039-Pyramimonas_sp.AAC.1